MRELLLETSLRPKHCTISAFTPAFVKLLILKYCCLLDLKALNVLKYISDVLLCYDMSLRPSRSVPRVGAYHEEAAFGFYAPLSGTNSHLKVIILFFFFNLDQSFFYLLALP